MFSTLIENLKKHMVKSSDAKQGLRWMLLYLFPQLTWSAPVVEKYKMHSLLVGKYRGQFKKCLRYSAISTTCLGSYIIPITVPQQQEHYEENRITA